MNFSLEPSFGAQDGESPWVDLVGEIPDNMVGLQITVRYDPGRVSVGGVTLALDEQRYRLATKHGNGHITFMIFSLSNRVLEPGTRRLLRLRVAPISPEDGEGSVASALEFVRAIAVDRQGRVVPTNVSIPVAMGGGEGAREFSLRPNYPNPFTQATGTNVELTVPTSELKLRADSRVTVSIYSLRGRLVRTLVNEPLPGGRFTYSWDGTNDQGAVVNSGIYILIMQADDFVKRRRIVFIR